MNLFVRKLRNGTRLLPEDEAILAGLVGRARRIEARGDIVSEGSEPRALTLIVEGWACRYKQLENGRRQTLSFSLPGDLCEPFGILPRFMDHSLGALTAVTIAQVSPEAVRNAARANPRIEEALWWDLLVAVAADQERTVSLAGAPPPSAWATCSASCSCGSPWSASPTVRGTSCPSRRSTSRICSVSRPCT